METKRFTYNNSSFICLFCKAIVPIHPSSSRDHCNHCLFSQHVDIFPGDRQNICQGLLEPIGLINSASKQKIVYRCMQCHKKTNNVAAIDDNSNAIIELSLLAY